MSYFEDQEDAWFANDCKGSPDEYKPYTDDSGFEPTTPVVAEPTPKKTQRSPSYYRQREKRNAAYAAKKKSEPHHD